MPKAKAPKPYCDGTMTQGAYNSFVKSALRKYSIRWKPINAARQAARTEQKINPKSGRLAWHFRCADCGNEFPAKSVVVDHIRPVVPLDMDVLDWNVVINNLFCNSDNLQVLCKECHDRKTKAENKERK